MHYYYLHGFASGPNSRKAQFFKQKFQDCAQKLEIIDLNLGDFSQITLTKQLNYAREQIAQRPCILLGSSLGGLSSLILAESLAQVKKVVLFAPALNIPRLWPQIIGSQALQEWQSRGSLKVFNSHFQQDFLLDYRFVSDLANYGALDLKRAIPSLIFHGQDDQTIPLQQSIDYALTHSQAQLHQLESGHGLENCLELIWQLSQTFIFE